MLLRIKDFLGIGTAAPPVVVTAPPAPVDVEDLGSEYPDDLDAVPAWRQRQLDRAAAIGITLPRYDTRRQWEEQVELATARFLAAEKSSSAVAPTQASRRPHLHGSEAARAFLMDLRVRGGAGTYTSEELKSAYTDHCQRCNREPTPDNILRPALLAEDGVRREIRDERVDGKRRRVAVWTIDDVVAHRLQVAA